MLIFKNDCIIKDNVEIIFNKNIENLISNLNEVVVFDVGFDFKNLANIIEDNYYLKMFIITFFNMCEGAYEEFLFNLRSNSINISLKNLKLIEILNIIKI